MKKLSGEWVFPVSDDPIFRGILILDDHDMVLEVLDPEKVDVEISDIQHFDGILCPGFVNTHCHLELSYLQGRMERHTGLDRFIRIIQQHYRHEPPHLARDQEFFMQSAEKEMVDSGIVAVGDIVSHAPSAEHRWIKENSSLYYHSFVEVLGSDPDTAIERFSKGIDHLKFIRGWNSNANATLAPHATYSLSRELWLLVKAHLQFDGGITTLHHLENEDEVLFFDQGTGPVRARLEDFGIPITSWSGTGMRPLAYLSGFLPEENPILFVHNTCCREEDLIIADRLLSRAWWCFCPGANLFIEDRLPDIRLFAGHHNRITLGTDSFASNPYLSLLEEMKILQRTFRGMELDTLIRWATLNGADFLGIKSWAGSFEKGKYPGVNLIEYSDTENFLLLPHTRIKPLTRSHPS